MYKNYYRREIDGLRAVAILPVILYHTFSLPFANAGFLGVDIFFVISGFLITNILLNELVLTKKISLTNFYNRRVRRILPTLFLVTMVSIYPAYKLLFPLTFKEFGQSLMGVSTLLPNLFFLLQGGYFSEPEALKPLLHTWSLGVEEQFYIFFPLFLIIFWKFLKKKTLILIILLSLFSLILANDLSQGLYASANFLIPITRMWELFAGAIISYYIIFIKKKDFNIYTNNTFSLAGALALIYSFILFDESTRHPSFYTLIPVLGTCLIILFATSKTIVGKILSLKYFVGVGLISYSLYLWHFPIFAFARHYNFMYNSQDGNFYNLSNYTYLSLIIITFIISYFSWKFVEQPFRKKKISNKNLIKVILPCFLIIFILGYFINYKNGMNERFSTEVVNYLNYNYSQPSKKIYFPCRESFSDMVLRKINGKKYSIKSFEDCRILGNKEYKPNTVLMGDSFTHSLLLPIINHSNREKKSIYFNINACPKFKDLRSPGDCLNAFNTIINNPDIHNVIVFYRWSDKFYSVNQVNGEYFCKEIKCKNIEEAKLFIEKEKSIQKNFKEIINLLNKKNKKIIIIYPLPLMGVDVPKSLATKVLNKTKPTIEIDYPNDFTNINTNVIKFFNSLEGNIIKVHPEKIFCNTFKANKCVANYKEKVFFWNKTHLSLDGGIMLFEQIIKKTNLF